MRAPAVGGSARRVIRPSAPTWGRGTRWGEGHLVRAALAAISGRVDGPDMDGMDDMDCMDQMDGPDKSM